jgi:alpha-beta hydrolase superfamily lysophospholipase
VSVIKKNNKLSNSIFRKFVIILITYISVSVAVYFFGEKFIYFPPAPSYSDNEKIIKLKTSTGEKISSFFYKNPEADYTILYCHGNAEDIGFFFNPILNRLYKLNFSVFVFDYNGYGTSQGKPSEKKTYDDARAAYKYVVEELKIPPEKIILYGHSLGAAVAIDLAANNKVAGVILEAPFISAFRVITQLPLFPFDRYINISKIDKLKSPVLVMHGKKDEVIPFWHGKKIFENVGAPKLSLWVDDADHINLAATAGIKHDNIIREFVALVKNSNH